MLIVVDVSDFFDQPFLLLFVINFSGGFLWFRCTERRGTITILQTNTRKSLRHARSSLDYSDRLVTLRCSSASDIIGT